jgi:hypothetical protein
MGQAPDFGQLRPDCLGQAPSTLASDHFFRNNGFLTTVFHVFVMFCRFRVQPFSTICVVEQGWWPRGIKAGAARTTTKRSFMTLDSDSHGWAVSTIALQPF